MTVVLICAVVGVAFWVRFEFKEPITWRLASGGVVIILVACAAYLYGALMALNLASDISDAMVESIDVEIEELEAGNLVGVLQELRKLRETVSPSYEDSTRLVKGLQAMTSNLRGARHRGGKSPGPSASHRGHRPSIGATHF